MIGTTISHYRILAKLGAGGMGVAYRAEDLVLRRPVALKFLSPEIAADDERRARFQREARLAAALNHPNTCTVYEVGQVDQVKGWNAADEPPVPMGTPFIVMELIEGETLAARLARSGRLAPAEVLDLAVQAAAGLAEAHAHRIVHRDLKPQNVMVTPSGRVKILDFGLAKPFAAIQRAETVISTADMISIDRGDGHSVVGTVAYMSPEQALGDPTDPRSDVFAFGIMLYELVAGHRPFRADTATAVVAKILEAEPEPLPSSAFDVPPALNQIIQRCLQKRPQDRYQDAHDLAADLDELRRRFSMGVPLSTGASTAVNLTTPNQSGPATSARESTSTMPPSRRATMIAGAITAVLVSLAAGWVLLNTVNNSRNKTMSSLAVLPLINSGSDPDGEYLGDGITEGIINSLSQLPKLRVMARSTVFSYKGKEIDPRKVGRELNVRAVFTGRVKQQGGFLIVGIELVDTADGAQLWGEQYTRNLADLVTLQTDIASRISEKLRLRLSGEEQKRLTKRHTENTEAYRLYLKGRYYLDKQTEEGFIKGLDSFKQAVDIDPSYALAWTGMADSYYSMSSLFLLPGEAIPKARAAAMRALEIDAMLPEAHTSLGIIESQYDWQHSAARKEFERAIELNPNYAAAHQLYGLHFYMKGQFDEALTELNTARQLDPLSVMIAAGAVWPLHVRGQYERAIKEVEKIVELSQRHPKVVRWLHTLRGEAYLQKAMNDEAIAEFLEGEAVSGVSPDTLEALRRAYQVSGLKGYWQKQLDLEKENYQRELDAAKAQSKERYVSPLNLAGLYARLGEKDQAFALLEKCYENRDENLLFVKAESLRVVSPWENIRSDPRFADLLRRMGLAP